MTENIIVGLVAALTCALMACSGSEGPTENEPATQASQASDVGSATIFYECNGTRKPCSDAEVERITHLASYSPLTGKFTESGATCQLVNCGACAL